MSPWNWVADYFAELSQTFGAGWNRFWYTPRSAKTLSILRIATGVLTLLYCLSHAWDLTRFFSEIGVLPPDAGQRIAGPYHPSLLYSLTSPGSLWLFYGLGLAAVSAWTAGWMTRISGVLSLATVLSLVHRAPMLTGPWEPVLTMLLAYLTLAPCGAFYSLDARRNADHKPQDSILANVCQRLIQVHLSGLLLMMALNKLAGEVWWTGDAVWWLMAERESRIVDLTFLGQSPYFVQFLNHAVVGLELSLAFLLWVRLARPLLWAAAAVLWTLMALATGLVGFYAALFAATWAFAEWKEPQA